MANSRQEPEKGWIFVGVPYNETTTETKLWIDGNIVNSEELTANFDFNALDYSSWEEITSKEK